MLPRHDLSVDDIYSEIFAALSEPVRIRIIRMIAETDELACTRLDETLPISKSTISYHIKVLHHAGLISVRKDGRYYHYRLKRDVLHDYLPGISGPARECRTSGACCQGPRARRNAHPLPHRANRRARTAPPQLSRTRGAAAVRCRSRAASFRALVARQEDGHMSSEHRAMADGRP